MILTGLVACDNVSWGGVELHLEAPPATDTAVADSAGAEAEPALPPLDLEPSLFLLDRSASSDGAGSPGPRLMPVALLGAEEMEPFPGPDEIESLGERFIRERMPPDRRFVVYARGARVGSFYPDSLGAEPTFGATSSRGPLCTPRPAVSGWLELLPEAAGEEHLLALPEGVAPGSAAPPQHGAYQPHAPSNDLLDASLNVASALYVTREILWPPSVRTARQDMHVIELPGGTEELIVATFLYGDSLAVGPAPPNAYSLFFIAGPGTVRPYEASYVRYREVGEGGKSVPRFLQHFDWDGDQREDALLELFGEDGRSFAALTHGEEGWEQVFEEECDLAPDAVASRPGEASVAPTFNAAP